MKIKDIIFPFTENVDKLWLIRFVLILIVGLLIGAVIVIYTTCMESHSPSFDVYSFCKDSIEFFLLIGILILFSPIYSLTRLFAFFHKKYLIKLHNVQLSDISKLRSRLGTFLSKSVNTFMHLLSLYITVGILLLLVASSDDLGIGFAFLLGMIPYTFINLVISIIVGVRAFVKWPKDNSNVIE